MATTALELINRAYYLSGVVARDQETVSGVQQTDGLEMLNALLEFKGARPDLIPYYQRGTFNGVVGQEEYFIPNLIQLEYLTFNIGDVRYSMLEKSRNKYFGTGRVDNIRSLPFDWRLEREEGGSRLYVYFLPSQAYVFNYGGKFGLTAVTLNQDLESTYDGFYIEYLRYCLAEMICQENDIEMTAGKLKRLAQYEKALINLSPPDLSIKKVSTLQRHRGLNWADVNVGLGWRP